MMKFSLISTLGIRSHCSEQVHTENQVLALTEQGIVGTAVDVHAAE